MLPVLSLLLLTASAASAVSLPEVSVQQRQVDKKYIFATFQSQKETEDDETTQLNIYASDDGIHYQEYAMDTYQPENGLVRDPSIIHYLGRYYVAHTTGWRERNIGIIASDDLRSWEPVTTVTFPEWVGRAWAPVSIYESCSTSKSKLTLSLGILLGSRRPELEHHRFPRRGWVNLGAIYYYGQGRRDRQGLE